MSRQQLDDLLYDATGDDAAMVAALEDEFSLQDIVAKLDAHDGRDFADPTSNMDQCQSYINRSLAAFGYPSPLQLGSPDAVDISTVCNCLYALLQQRQRDIDYRDEMTQAQQRLQSQVNLLESKRQRLEGSLEAKEREIAGALAKERVATTQHNAAMKDLTAERDELQKLANNLQARHNQHVHEIRRKEREYVKLQERLHALLMEKRRDSKQSMEIMNFLQREGHKRGTWTGKRPDQDFYKMIVDAYETKQKDLVMENADLRASLRQLQTEMRELLNAQNEAKSAADKGRALEEASASISALEQQLAAEQHRVAALQAEVREHREQKGASVHRQLVQIRHLEAQLSAQQKKMADAITSAERDKASAIAEAVSAATAATAAAAEKEQRRAVAAAIEATASASAMDRAALEQALREERERKVEVPQLADQAVQTDEVEPRMVDFGMSPPHQVRGARDDISIVSATDPAAADLAALPGDMPRDQLEALLTEKLQRLQKKMETFDAETGLGDGSESGHALGGLHAGRTSSETYTETDSGMPLGGWSEREMELARQLEYARAIIHEQEAVIQFSLMASNDNPLDLDPVGYRSDRQAAMEEDVLEEKLRHIEEERRQAQAAAAKLDEERRDLEKTRRMLQEEQESFRTTLQMWAPGLGAGLFLAKTVSGTSTPKSEHGTSRSMARASTVPTKGGAMESVNFNAYTDERSDNVSATGSGSPTSQTGTPKMLRPKPLAMQVDLRRLKEVFYTMDVHGFVDKKQYLHALRNNEEVKRMMDMVAMVWPSTKKKETYADVLKQVELRGPEQMSWREVADFFKKTDATSFQPT